MITDFKREGGISGFDIECDECGETEFFDEDRFQDFIEGARKLGWKIFKDDADDNWTHLCADCWQIQTGRAR